MITGVVLTHNEEHNIVSCVEHLRPHVGEIILVDTESTDQTVNRARPLVDKVLSHAHVPNFDAARNVAINEAKFDWMWFVDADERIPQKTGWFINELIRTQGDDFEIVNIPFKSYFCGKWMEHCGWWPGYTSPRVLKRGFFEFSKQLHGGVRHKGREVLVPADPELGIDHYSYDSIEHWITKCNRYTTTESLQLVEQDLQWDWRFATNAMVHDLWEHFEKHDATLDGDRGWILTWLSSQYRWLSVAKLVDHGRHAEAIGGPSSVPSSLDEFVESVSRELSRLRAINPEPPFGLHLRGPFFSSSKVGEALRGVGNLLVCSQRETSIQNVGGDKEVSAKVDGLTRALVRLPRPRCPVVVTFDCDDVPEVDTAAAFNVYYSSIGAEKYSDDGIKSLDRYDELWINDASQGPAWESEGIASERIRIITESDDGENYSAAGILEAADALESIVKEKLPSPVLASDIRVQWDGEFFAGHSFANVNEQIIKRLVTSPGISLSLLRRRYTPEIERRDPLKFALQPYFGRELPDGPQIVVRHTFPPDFRRPPEAKWVHIQPWEFGTLPSEWVAPLRDLTDEIWVMSDYVKRVYVDSGVSEDKIAYIPWGVDESVFNPDATPRTLPTEKSFRFLFVGGTIARKGADRVVDAYLSEFKRTDDACLVIKDTGVNSFYIKSPIRIRIREAMEDPKAPQIIYLDNEMTPGQLASLYCSCDLLLAPYRGEGFGLPVIEAAACGIPVIVPQGGPTDDFLLPDASFLLKSKFVPIPDMNDTCGIATELEIDLDELRKTMRTAFEDASKTQKMGLASSDHVRKNFTWDRTVSLIVERLKALSATPRRIVRREQTVQPEAKRISPGFAAAVLIQESDETTNLAAELADTLGRIRPFVSELVVRICQNVGSVELLKGIVREYNAEFIDTPTDNLGDWKFSPDRVVLLCPGEFMTPEDARRIQESATISERWTQGRGVQVQYGQNSPVIENRVIQLGRTAELTDEMPETADTSANLITIFSERTPAVNLPIEWIKWGGHEKSTDKNSNQFGRLGKPVLIQMADGAHIDLLKMTRDHHQSYCDHHGMDYWCHMGNPSTSKRAGWGKITLALSAIRAGYDPIIWLDADAVVRDKDVDVAALCRDGIAMVQHPNPQHWNTGFMVIRANQTTECFLEQVERCPENDSGWMEQLAVNEIGLEPVYQNLFERLDIRFNCIPGVLDSDAPVIVAGHGLEMPTRKQIIADGLAFEQSLESDFPRKIRRRNEFPALLNEMELIGEGVEVGVFKGEFSKHILDTWEGKRLHLVDPWKHCEDYDDIANVSDEEFEKVMASAQDLVSPFKDRAEIHRAFSVAAAEEFDLETLDFVYVDADHSYEAVADDLRAWYPRVKPGGVFAGHDYLDGQLPEGDFGVKSAVDEFAKSLGLRVYSTNRDAWPTWYLKKPLSNSSD